MSRLAERAFRRVHVGRQKPVIIIIIVIVIVIIIIIVIVFVMIIIMVISFVWRGNIGAD